MAESAKKENLKAATKNPDPEMLQNLDFLKSLEMMEMVVDTGLDKKMKATPEGQKKC